MRSLSLVVLAGSMALVPPAAASTRPLRLGFTDSVFASPAPEGPLWLDRARAAGGATVLIGSSWQGIAPARRPAGFDPTDPADPAYDFSGLDAQVRAAVARGLAPTVSTAYAPSWAEGPGRPSSATPGTWRPDPQAFGDFATALARRYTGTFVDPGGVVLPRVRAFQAWTEPNLALHLAPTWANVGREFRPVSPDIYRGLLNAFYTAMKTVRSDNVVVTAGTAPFGDVQPGGRRIPPARFWRDVLCVGGRPLRPRRCPDPAHFDVLAHHPYSVGGPYRRARYPDDVSVPDLGKITRPLRVAEASGRALPAGRKPLWVTEFSWDSRPPDPDGVPLARHARWLEEALYVLWRQGVAEVDWYNIRDQAPPYPSTYQSGLYFRDGRPKPALTAYRFPFVVERSHGRRVAWGRAPRGGTLIIERLTRGRWTPVKRFSVRRQSTFLRQVGARKGDRVRARVGDVASLTWTVA